MTSIRARFAAAYAILAAILCAAGAATYAFLSSGAEPARSAPSAPAASDFARIFVGVTNAYAQAHHDPARISQAHCVAASPGLYMCSYATARRGGAKQCHVMQARWTPGGPSSFEVILAGRTARCGSLREALRSLR